MRLCDLGVRIDGSPLEPAINQLYDELHARGVSFRPHVWLSNEWFTPDKVPGIAIPFYLAHPRLRELERSQMLEVEGGTHDWCMRILRHEAGHALDNAYALHRRRRYRMLFGNWFDPYPEAYSPKPYTKKYVLHLDMWYAQAHPAEDFAETFAVWLNPRSNWREVYKGWPALRKLTFVDATMSEVAGTPPKVRSREQYKTLRTLTTTLRDHYERKRTYYVREHPKFYDRDLLRLFSDERTTARRDDAATFLETIRGEARMMISRWTGESQLTIDRTFADMLQRVRQLNLRLRKSAAETKVDVMMMLAVQTMNYLTSGRHRVVV